MAEPTILDRIVAGKHDELAAAQAAVPAAQLRAVIAGLPAPRDFAAALCRPGQVRLIAEVKKASPSAGLIRPDFDAVAIAQAYAAGGAACLSVLTDERWFQGSADYLRAVRGVVDLPILRKDFTLDEYQLLEARAWGADAVLLIAAILAPARLAELMGCARDLGLTALVEVHSAEETMAAVDAGAKLVGINNRDLRVFRTDLATTVELRALIPADRVVVSESGIRTADDVALLRTHGVQAMLVGEALMRQPDVLAATRALVGAGCS
ncbi:MAG: indole-3-glycerol phosphate synthase TrpC [Armatimonadetes bacterium]|nr:indole-3-glycerol phosphate synthase TrpC [Armatimonadota bacterium]